MIFKLKKIMPVLLLILVIPLVTVSIWSWRSAAPDKPDPIPLGDYTYTVEYTEHRIDK